MGRMMALHHTEACTQQQSTTQHHNARPALRWLRSRMIEIEGDFTFLARYSIGRCARVSKRQNVDYKNKMALEACMNDNEMTCSGGKYGRSQETNLSTSRLAKKKEYTANTT